VARRSEDRRTGFLAIGDGNDILDGVPGFRSACGGVMRVQFTVQSHIEAVPPRCRKAREVQVYQNLDAEIRELIDGEARLVARVRLGPPDDQGMVDVVKSSDGRFWRDVSAADPATIAGRLTKEAGACGDPPGYALDEVSCEDPCKLYRHTTNVAAALKDARRLAVWRGRLLEETDEPVWLVTKTWYLSGSESTLYPSFGRPQPGSISFPFRLTQRVAAEEHMEDLGHGVAGGYEIRIRGDAEIIEAAAFQFRTDVEHRLKVLEALAEDCKSLIGRLESTISVFSDDNPLLARMAGRLKTAIENELQSLRTGAELPDGVRR
jgi:hypothetical protein